MHMCPRCGGTINPETKVCERCQNINNSPEDINNINPVFNNTGDNINNVNEINQNQVTLQEQMAKIDTMSDTKPKKKMTISKAIVLVIMALAMLIILYMVVSSLI